MDTRIHAQLEWARNAVALTVYQKEGDRIYVAAPVVMSQAESACHIDPTIYLPMKSAQELMDSLWQCGLRPSEGTGSAGALKATQDHIADLRKIVFGLLPEREKPTC